MTHDVLDVALGPGVWAWAIADVVEPTAGADGTKQAVWHVAACALQVIMQFVVVEDCAKRIFFAGGPFFGEAHNSHDGKQNGQAPHGCLYRSSVAPGIIAR